MFLRLLLLVPAVVLGGCATLPGEPRPAGAPDALEQALRAADCRAAYAVWETEGVTPADRALQVGQVCLQAGDFLRSRQISAAFLEAQPTHPDADYAAYIHALAGFGAWSRSSLTDPDVRVREGRAVFQEIALYLRERPLSEYVDNLAPRLVRLREGIAEGEFALAQREYRQGNSALARARAEYVMEYYPRTQAAADAARLLMAVQSP